MRDLLLSLMVIGMSAAFLVHLSLIAIYGDVLIREPSLIILSLEIAGLIGCFLFALVNFIRLLRKR